jgi:hypothetical protein
MTHLVLVVAVVIAGIVDILFVFVIVVFGVVDALFCVKSHKQRIWISALSGRANQRTKHLPNSSPDAAAAAWYPCNFCSSWICLNSPQRQTIAF